MKQIVIYKEERMIKRIIIIFILISLYIIPNSYATDEIISSQMETLNLSSFIKEGEKYTEEIFPDIDLSNLLNSAIRGEIDNKQMYSGILSVFGDEIVSAISLLGSILIVIVIHSLLKNFSENLSKNEGIGQIAYYVEYILIVTIIMSNFSNIINMMKEAISNLVGFVNCIVPILLALMSATGSITSVGLIQSLIIFAVVFIANTITLFVLPIALIATALGIVSNLSERIQIGKLSKFLKSGVTWFLGVIVTIFVSILSLEGGLTSNVDGLAAKGIKSAATTFIPVVGKALGESVDMVIGSTALLKNSIGIVGMFIIIGICAMPIIKLAILTITYHFASSICEPLADKKIVSLLEQMGGTFKVLLGIMFFASVLLIIGLAMCIKISNSGMMYR